MPRPVSSSRLPAVFCDKGMCVTPQTLACVGAGGACTMTSDCCNDAVVPCMGGTCTPQIPK